jgi:hypothetical protein
MAVDSSAYRLFPSATPNRTDSLAQFEKYGLEIQMGRCLADSASCLTHLVFKYAKLLYALPQVALDKREKRRGLTLNNVRALHVVAF